MHSILLLRDKLKNIYTTYNIYIDFAIKFIVIFIALNIINYNFKTSDIMSNIFVIIGLSLVCSFFSNTLSVFVAFFYTCMKIYSLSHELLIIFAAFCILAWVFYFTFNIKMAYLMLIIPILFVFKLYYLAPILLAFIFTPTVIGTMCGGIIVYYILLHIRNNTSSFANTTNIDMLHKFINVINAMVFNKKMILMLISAIICFLCVYLIRRLSVKYSYYSALIVGLWSIFFVSFIAKFYFSLDINIIELVASCLITTIISVIYIMLVNNIDYSRTEYLQYEDDDYLYYVKAVPKISVSGTEKKVTTIIARQQRKKRSSVERE